MSDNPDSSQTPDSNADPLTGEAGAHPVATGIGAAAVGGAGLAAAVAVAGPIGVAAAVVGGAIIGGYVGKAAGELIDPTAEEAFWREAHPTQPFAQDATFDDYAAAYRTGYSSYDGLRGHERSFEEVEPELAQQYAATGARLPWPRVRPAARAAWERVHRGEARRRPATSGEGTGMSEALASENLQSGALSNAQMPR